MIDNVLDIVDYGKSKRSLRITDELLMAPTFDDISNRRMLFVKESLFEFIARCNRNITLLLLEFTMLLLTSSGFTLDFT